MMQNTPIEYDFDALIDRRHTHCEKWDSMEERFGVSPEDGLALWVADMEFRPPPAATEALRTILDHGVYGYFGDSRDYYAAIAGWMRRRHGWEVDTDWICTTHGLVNGFHMLVQAFCRPGDGVIVQPPVYPPFFHAAKANGCHVVENPLAERDGRHYFDMDGLAKAVDHRTRMLLLCSPQNPGGRVWTRVELETLAQFCFERDILIVADEIHHDLVYPDGPDRAQHTVLATLGPDYADRVITCTSATKTFNMAGTMTGNVIIPNSKLREQYQRQLARTGIFDPNAFGPAAATAAYSQGDGWLDALLQYLQGNRESVDAFVEAELPGVQSMKLDATYLAWLDFSGTGLDMKEIERRTRDIAKLALNQGPTFGTGGELHLRLNFACPRTMLDDALERLVKAFG